MVSELCEILASAIKTRQEKGISEIEIVCKIDDGRMCYKLYGSDTLIYSEMPDNKCHISISIDAFSANAAYTRLNGLVYLLTEGKYNIEIIRRKFTSVNNVDGIKCPFDQFGKCDIICDIENPYLPQDP